MTPGRVRPSAFPCYDAKGMKTEAAAVCDDLSQGDDAFQGVGLGLVFFVCLFDSYHAIVRLMVGFQLPPCSATACLVHAGLETLAPARSAGLWVSCSTLGFGDGDMLGLMVSCGMAVP